MTTQLRQHWPYMRTVDKALIIILGATALLTLTLLIIDPSFEGLGATISTIAIWLLTTELEISRVEAYLLRRTITALLRQKYTHPENW